MLCQKRYPRYTILIPEKAYYIIVQKQLVSLFEEYNLYNREVIILCIGSDRSTGDSLGPLVGHELNKYHLNNITVYGTLEDPVHAANLSDKIKLINDKHVYPFIIAIDASLGTMEHIGFVTIGRGPLHPGLGVSKNFQVSVTFISQVLLIFRE